MLWCKVARFWRLGKDTIKYRDGLLKFCCGTKLPDSDGSRKVTVMHNVGLLKLCYGVKLPDSAGSRKDIIKYRDGLMKFCYVIQLPDSDGSIIDTKKSWCLEEVVPWCKVARFWRLEKDTITGCDGLWQGRFNHVLINIEKLCWTGELSEHSPVEQIQLFLWSNGKREKWYMNIRLHVGWYWIKLIDVVMQVK